MNDKIAAELSRLLASNYLLYIKTQHFHWNVTGPQFGPLHKMLEEHYDNLAEANDEIAERIRALGKTAPGTAKQFIELSLIQEQSKTPPAQEMIRELLADHRKIIEFIRELMGLAAQASDEGTNDLLSGRISWHEKTAWMLESSI